jgi:hypothetical protein
VVERDLQAFRWTLECLTEDEELEPFIAGIPSFLAADNLTDADEIVKNLLHEDDLALGARILGLLKSCGRLGPQQSEWHATVSMAAICTLTCMDLNQTDGEVTGKIPWFNYLLAVEEYTQNKSRNVASCARLTSLLLIPKLLRIMDNAGYGKDWGQVATVIFMLKRRRQELECDEFSGIPSLQDARLAAVVALLVGLLESPPLPMLLTPGSFSIARSLTPGLNCYHRDRNLQQEFVQIIGDIVDELKLPRHESRLNWDVVNELLPLLGTLNDPDAITEAMKVLKQTEALSGAWSARRNLAARRNTLATSPKTQLEKSVDTQDVDRARADSTNTSGLRESKIFSVIPLLERKVPSCDGLDEREITETSYGLPNTENLKSAASEGSLKAADKGKSKTLNGVGGLDSERLAYMLSFAENAKPAEEALNAAEKGES